MKPTNQASSFAAVLTTLTLSIALVVLAPPVQADVGVPDSVGLFDPATGEWHLRHDDGSVDRFFYGVPGDLPLLGDWDCDGVDTVGMFRPSDSDTVTWSITGGNPVGLFGMVGSTGELFVANNATLAPGQYVLTITMSDGTVADVETVTVDVV